MLDDDFLMPQCFVRVIPPTSRPKAEGEETRWKTQAGKSVSQSTHPGPLRSQRVQAWFESRWQPPRSDYGKQDPTTSRANDNFLAKTAVRWSCLVVVRTRPSRSGGTTSRPSTCPPSTTTASRSKSATTARYDTHHTPPSLTSLPIVSRRLGKAEPPQNLPCLTWLSVVVAVHGPVPGCGALPPQGSQGRGLGVQGHLPTTGPGGKRSDPSAHHGPIHV